MEGVFPPSILEIILDITNFKRDPTAIKTNLVIDKNFKITCKKETRIYIPVKYASRNLASFTNGIRSVAIFPVVVGNTYATLKATASIDLTPSSTRTVEIEGVSHLELFFEAGSQISPASQLVKQALLVYYISDHFLSRGDIPWFFDYQDVAELFDTSLKHAGANLKVDPVVFDVIASALARQPKDRTKYLRHTLKSAADLNVKEASFISLRNIELGATNTTAKLSGNYFSDGLASALVTKTKTMEGIEEHLRR